MSWWNEKARHGLAAKGIKTKNPLVRRNRLMEIDKKKYAQLSKALDDYEASGDEKAIANIKQQMRDLAETVDGVPVQKIVKEETVEVESQSKREQEKAKWS